MKEQTEMVIPPQTIKVTNKDERSRAMRVKKEQLEESLVDFSDFKLKRRNDRLAARKQRRLA